jgi:hypothetical protein
MVNATYAMRNPKIILTIAGDILSESLEPMYPPITNVEAITKP